MSTCRSEQWGPTWMLGVLSRMESRLWMLMQMRSRLGSRREVTMIVSDLVADATNDVFEFFPVTSCATTLSARATKKLGGASTRPSRPSRVTLT